MEVRICIGEFCHLQGSEIVVRTFMDLIEKEKLGDSVDLKGVFCHGTCQEPGISVKVGDVVHKTRLEDAEKLFRTVIMPAAQARV
jgi:NADH:ubiquinone oxidoreductase subunit E